MKISRFAMDGKVPHSDLYVSPWHAIYIDNMLIPVKYLVNGVTILADAKLEALSLTYFHIELDTHEAILAEGLAVESFLRDNPDAFDNADEYVRLYGSPGEPLTPFAPYVPYMAAKSWLHISAAHSLPFTISASRSTRSVTALPIAQSLPALPDRLFTIEKSWTSLVRAVVLSWRTSTAVRVHK